MAGKMLKAATWRRVDATLTLLDELDSVGAFPCVCGGVGQSYPPAGCKWCRLAALPKALRQNWPAN